jgi:hypothetical protein
MNSVLDAAALFVLLSFACFALCGLFALPLLRDLAAKHGLPKRLALVGLVPLLGLPLFFARLLRTDAPR